MPIVEKHRLSSTGCGTPSPSARASVNSFSKAACSTPPQSARRSAWRLRNERWQTGAGAPSRPTWSVSIAPLWGA